MNVITMGAHILDVLVRPVTDIPPGQETAGAIGADPAGDLVVSLLDRAGVDTCLVVRKPDVPTSISVLPIRPNGERPSLHLLGANLAYTLDDIDWAAVAAQDHLHLGGTEMLGSDFATRVLRHAKENGVTTSVDLIAPGGMGTFDLIAPALAPYGLSAAQRRTSPRLHWRRRPRRRMPQAP